MIEDGRLVWDTSPVLIAADDIDSSGESSPIDEAREWLLGQLEDGPVASAKLLKQAKADGLAEKTVRRAQLELGIIAERHGQAGNGDYPEGRADRLVI